MNVHLDISYSFLSLFIDVMCNAGVDFIFHTYVPVVLRLWDKIS